MGGGAARQGPERTVEPDVSNEFDPGPVRPASPIAELAAHPESPRWARDCAWVPGTGHCRNRPCSVACLFRAQREAEALRLERTRRQRRPAKGA
jgi:hypothetical protein